MPTSIVLLGRIVDAHFLSCLCLECGEIHHQHAVNEDVASAHFAQEDAGGGADHRVHSIAS